MTPCRAMSSGMVTNLREVGKRNYRMTQRGATRIAKIIHAAPGGGPGGAVVGSAAVARGRLGDIVFVRAELAGQERERAHPKGCLRASTVLRSIWPAGSHF